MQKSIFSIAWDRFSLVTSIIGEVQGKVILTLFYFTILAPFGLGSRLMADPLHRKTAIQTWIRREPIPTDLESAKQQG